MDWGRGRFDEVTIEVSESRVSESRIFEGLENDRGLGEVESRKFDGRLSQDMAERLAAHDKENSINQERWRC